MVCFAQARGPPQQHPVAVRVSCLAYLLSFLLSIFVPSFVLLPNPTTLFDFVSPPATVWAVRLLVQQWNVFFGMAPSFARLSVRLCAVWAKKSLSLWVLPEPLGLCI